jgi:hypothetical protein
LVTAGGGGLSSGLGTAGPLYSLVVKGVRPSCLPSGSPTGRRGVARGAGRGDSARPAPLHLWHTLASPGHRPHPRPRATVPIRLTGPRDALRAGPGPSFLPAEPPFRPGPGAPGRRDWQHEGRRRLQVLNHHFANREPSLRDPRPTLAGRSVRLPAETLRGRQAGAEGRAEGARQRGVQQPRQPVPHTPAQLLGSGERFLPARGAGRHTAHAQSAAPRRAAPRRLRAAAGGFLAGFYQEPDRAGVTAARA